MGDQESFMAEYTEFTGNIPAIAAQCMPKLPSSNKFTYKCDQHIFNFLVQDGYAYCVVAKEYVGEHISIELLEHIKADFKKRYSGGKADTAAAKSLNEEFGPLMKEHMLKSTMMDNIDKILARGTCTLSNKAYDLSLFAYMGLNISSFSCGPKCLRVAHNSDERCGIKI